MTCCPDGTRLKEWLDGSLPDAEHESLAGHIDTCECCQHTLDTLTVPAHDWTPAAGDEPALQRLVEHLEAQTAPSTGGGDKIIEEVLGLLDAPARAGDLGRVGCYEVVEVLGCGGMGVVLKAFDGRLNRHVALKMLSPLLAASPGARQRFVREGRAAAAVTHEHVVAVYDVAEVKGLPFLVMQCVEGTSLQAVLDRQGPLPAAQVVRIGAQVAAGLAAAHEKGLVHRDVKPANILIENGTGSVKLTDFGLARAADDATLSQSGVVVGTPQYMAPEQARGEAVDHRADLFSLGTVLYTLCTGKAPFRASSTLAVLRRVAEEEPEPLRKVAPRIPASLAAIIARLLAKNPAQRFASAAEVTRQLEQPHGPERPVGRRWRSAALVVLAASALLAVVGLVASRWPKQDSPPAPVAVDAVEAVPTLMPLFSLVGPRDAVGPLSFSPDSRWLAAGSGDDVVRVWDLRTRQVVEELRGFRKVVFTRDGQSLFLAGSDHTIQRWNLAERKIDLRLGAHRARIRSLVLSPDGTQLASGSEDGTAVVWDIANARAVWKWNSGGGWVLQVAFSPDGKRLAACHADNTIRLWTLPEGVLLAHFGGHQGWLPTIAFSRDGKSLVAGGDSVTRSMVVWSIPAGTELRKLEGHRGMVNSCVYLPGTDYLASVGSDRLLRIWNVAAGKEVARGAACAERLWFVAVSADGKRLATGGDGGALFLWDITPLSANP